MICPPPGPGQVHVWRVDAADPAVGGGALSPPALTEAEIARADAFRAPQDRARYILFRTALRRLLGRYLGDGAARAPFALGPNGKPCLPGAALDFNVTHSGDLGLIAFSASGPVGVDLELARPMPQADRLAARIFSADERAVYAALPPEAREPAFLRCWTRKEAYLKATGEGLSFPPADVSVSFAPGDAPRLLHVEGRPNASSLWHLRDLSRSDAVAALVVARNGMDLHHVLHDFKG